MSGSGDEHISYFYGSYANHEAKRPRKLLLNRKEIRNLEAESKTPGFTIIPTLIFIDENGRAKVDIALARGKKEIRQTPNTKRKRRPTRNGSGKETLLKHNEVKG